MSFIDGFFFDGAFGTYYRTLTGSGHPCEMANLTDPASVLKIHKAYVEAGADAVKTNTFGANPGTMDAETLARILREGVRLAREAAGERRTLWVTGPAIAPDLAGTEYVGSEGVRHTYVFDASRVPMARLLAELSKTPGLRDVETGEIPIETVIAELYLAWQRDGVAQG